jgi:NADH-quinone oxidoreductase subunit J
METVFGLMMAFLAIFSGLMVVLHRNPMVNIVFLILNLACIAVFFLMLGGQFIAAIQIIVYAGAIMVLFVFVIMLLNLRRDDDATVPGRVQRFLYLPAAAILAAALLYALVHHRIPFPGARPVPSAEFGTVEGVGQLLFTDHLFAFEFASLLLVVAMIGAVMLAKRHLD